MSQNIVPYFKVTFFIIPETTAEIYNPRTSFLPVKWNMNERLVDRSDDSDSKMICFLWQYNSWGVYQVQLNTNKAIVF